MDITENQAKEVLSPYHDALQNCIVAAWEEYHSALHEIKHKLSPRSQSSIIFDFITDNVSQCFEGEKGINISRKRGLFLVNFGNKVVVRFKKLRNNRASCIPTKQTLSFFRQLELPGIPSPKRCIVGYQLNCIRTEIRNISVVYPRTASKNYWQYDLELFESSSLETPYKQIPIAQEVVPKEDRITVKETTHKNGL